MSDYCPFCDEPVGVDNIKNAPYALLRKEDDYLSVLCSGCQAEADRYGVATAAYRQWIAWNDEAGDGLYELS